MMSSYQIRKKAREILGKSIFSDGWGYPIYIIVAVTILSSFLNLTLIGNLIVSGLISVAMAKYFLCRVRKEIAPNHISPAFDGIRRNFLGTMLTGILYNLFVAIGVFLLVIPGIIFSYSFSMVFYIINDHPEMSAIEALRESNRLMKGHKMEYFFLQMSFIGWMIVGFLSLGVGLFWVCAYMNTANAIFYNQLIEKKAENR